MPSGACFITLYAGVNWLTRKRWKALEASANTVRSRCPEGSESPGTDPTQRAPRCMPPGALQTGGLTACIICTLQGFVPWVSFISKGPGLRGGGGRGGNQGNGLFLAHTLPLFCSLLIAQSPIHRHRNTLRMNKLRPLHGRLGLEVNSFPARPILSSIYYTDWREGKQVIVNSSTATIQGANGGYLLIKGM